MACIYMFVATESNPVSVCPFCSDSRAGVRWMVHESNQQPGSRELRIDTIKIEFQCEILEENVVSNLQLEVYWYLTALI